MSKIFFLLIAITLVLSTPTISQKKFDLSVYTGSGISFLGGSGATNKSYYIIGDVVRLDEMKNPYGKKPLTNFFAGLQAKMLLPSNYMLMLSTQYEQTGGRLTADSILYLGFSRVDGKYKRNYDFISVNPEIGRTILQKKVKLVLHTGLDYAFKLSLKDQFDYTDQSCKKYSIRNQGMNPETNDLRFTIGSSITRKRWTLDLNYKHGLSNYNKNGNDKVFSRLLHIRLIYTFLK